MAFIVNPVKPKVGFISGAVLSAIESFSPFVGGYDGGRGAGRTGVRLPYMLPTTLLKVKRKFLIAEISVLYAGQHFRLSSVLLARQCAIFAFTRALMKIAGFLLLLSGLFLVLSALALLREPSPQALFVLLGIAVEVLGLAMVFRTHLAHKERRR
ncbi:MAG TPA: hypothetical protein VH640_28145 [Bryobacteraceae bacterium]|jgi:hypothetical protein